MEGLIGLVVLVVLAVPALLIAALVMIGGLKGRVASLEATVAQWQSRPQQVAAHAEAEVADTPLRGAWSRERPAPEFASRDDAAPPAAPAEVAPGTTIASPTPTVFASQAAMPPPLPPIAPRPDLADASGPGIVRASPSQASPSRASSHSVRAPSHSVRAPTAPDPLTLAVRAVRRWFTEGNVPVKVGVLVLFAGVAALLKYASDQGWVRFPPELRLAAVALAAIAGLVIGWRQREAKRSFGLSLQGGAIGVLLLVVFAAYRFFGFIPAQAAFALSVVLVAGLGVLAVKQDAIALALLGVLAGFLAPIWLSTGQGSHVALFGYYALLNAAIFAIAWVRPWRALNVLGFVFTFGIGSAWGVLRYRAQDFATTEPFLLLFFAFYLLIPILYAWRRAAGRRDLVDGCLVFGTPLVVFSLQAGLLRGDSLEAARMPLALCALGLGAIYAALAWWLQRREHFAALVAPYAILAVGFATLAVPLALSAQATGCVFALEGAALVWLGLRQHNPLQQISGGLLQLLAAASFMIGFVDAAVPMQAIANPTFMSALLIALAGLSSAWSCWRASAAAQAAGEVPSALATLAVPYYLWGLAWWIGNGLYEIGRFVAHDSQPDMVLVLIVASGWIAVEVNRRLREGALALTGILALVAILPLALVQDAMHANPLAGSGWIAWIVVAVAGWRILQCLRDQAPARVAFAHVAWLLAWPLVLSLAVHDVSGGWALGMGWRDAVIALPWLAMAAALQWRPRWVAQPLMASFEDWRGGTQVLFAAILALGGLLLLSADGDAHPLPWLPLLNPLDLSQLAALAILAAWLASSRAPAQVRAFRTPLLAIAGFILISVITLRGTHHWGGVAWAGTMFGTSLVQTSLTLVWSVLGVLGWIIGSRRGQRGLWRAGAILMAVVLAKLVLIDRQYLGSGFGIASFLAYGLLCTAVGYFAPVPPRATTASGVASGEAVA